MDGGDGEVAVLLWGGCVVADVVVVLLLWKGCVFSIVGVVVFTLFVYILFFALKTLLSSWVINVQGLLILEILAHVSMKLIRWQHRL